MTNLIPMLLHCLRVGTISLWVPSAYSAPWIGFKALPSGYAATNPWSLKAEGNTSAKAVAGALYSFWQDPHALDVGVQTAPVRAPLFRSIEDCTMECDQDSTCAGITVQMTLQRTQIGTTCKLVRGDSTPGRFKRTVVRTDLDRVAFPTAYLCPSGFSPSPDGTAACAPVSTPRQVTFLLTAQGNCDEASIAAVKKALFDHLSNPEAAFGVYTPNLFLEVSCLTADGALVSQLP